jgi:hypothetical protein
MREAFVRQMTAILRIPNVLTKEALGFFVLFLRKNMPYPLSDRMAG